MLGNTEGRAANKSLFTFASAHHCKAFICHSEKWANVAQKSDDLFAPEKGLTPADASLNDCHCPAMAIISPRTVDYCI
jgi:hypothetical protein